MPESTLPSTATRRSKNYRKYTNGKNELKTKQKKTKTTTFENFKMNRSGAKEHQPKYKTFLHSRLSNLLVIWHLANENFSNLTRLIRVIVHLSLSENGDVSTNSVRKKNKNRISTYYLQ